MTQEAERINKVAFHLYKTFGTYTCDTAEQWWEDMLDSEMSWWQETAREIIALGYRLPPKLELIGDEEIKWELTRIQPEGFNWGDITQSELVKFKAIAQTQLDADRKAIEEVK